MKISSLNSSFFASFTTNLDNDNTHGCPTSNGAGRGRCDERHIETEARGYHSGASVPNVHLAVCVRSLRTVDISFVTPFLSLQGSLVSFMWPQWPVWRVCGKDLPRVSHHHHLHSNDAHFHLK